MENGQLPLSISNATNENWEIVSLMALSKIRGIGLRTLRTLLERFGQLSSVWKTPADELLLTLGESRLPRLYCFFQW